MAVILDVRAKPLQRHVPTRRNLVEIVAEFCELLRLNLPQAVSPHAITAHETNILKHAEMLGNGLARNMGALLQPNGRERPIRAQSGNDRQTHRVSQSGENRRRLRQLSCAAISSPHGLKAFSESPRYFSMSLV